MSDTTARLRDQWASPADVSTILMVIGGDVVQKAFAQGTGTIYTPVCFSFGCVAYAFVALVSVIGHGRLLPEPDYPAKVINLESGYSRENKNWVVGRLLRDIETSIARRTPLRDNGIRISVFEALKNPNGRAGFSWSHIHYVGLIFIAVQLALAVVPIVLHRDWSVMLITGAGTVLVQLTGVLPQWRVEKLPNRQKSQANFALTSGNGSNDIIVILGRGRCLNLEEMAASASPRNGRPWEKLEWLSTYKEYPVGDPRVATRRVRESRYFRGLPLGFWITRITCSALSLLWLLLLINVAATGNNSWYLLGVGATGMFQNGWLAAVERPSKQRNLPIDLIETIRTKKVMDGLMDFEVTYGRARPLLEEFFPGKLKANELKWWNGDFEPDKLL
ncbi:hypothetical protein S40285_07215 [Stachybotrys chlorohalonatus IBT 40285]|uniref:Uncharacterized protein n=1 Tax=Stachybotrys chlorohalonatus (strain IBT 40285) TaxID=1283841 RepID=A0A084QWG3_STAC4|nr:hypothetical protein S40285_07215 [Stachybotrys chlorohalonata IBT 40285]